MNKEPKVVCKECNWEIVEFDYYGKSICNNCEYQNMIKSFIGKRPMVVRDEHAYINEEDFEKVKHNIESGTLTGTKEKK